MTDYEKLKEIYDEIDRLIEMRVDASASKFRIWREKTQRFLMKKYGTDSYEARTFQERNFSLSIFSLDTPETEFVESCRAELETVKGTFLEYLDEMKDEVGGTAACPITHEIRSFSRVFIVHGHNGELKEGVARLLEQQGIQPIILHEQVNRGATIIEKIESNSDVQAAVCLFTADDYGHSATDQEKQPRARQNVVFEAGYFMGKLGRENIVIISDKGVELPSDLQGVVYTDTQFWKMKLLKELKAIGYSIDFNKAMS